MSDVRNWGRDTLVSVVVVRSVAAGKNQFGGIKHWAPVCSPWNPSGDTCMAFSRSLELLKLHAMFGVRFSERIYVSRNKYTEVKPLLPAVLSAYFTGWREVCVLRSFPYLSLSSGRAHLCLPPPPPSPSLLKWFRGYRILSALDFGELKILSKSTRKTWNKTVHLTHDNRGEWRKSA